ncbi:RecN [Desulfamplus magnetovallimortis]|uniref:DNA repair protein RecN n=1 Tax=Desulfamplus magnetovallimortis TaxID=1246637 RepID=A0A1W1H4X8_9BACT|nr:DNA repair protein RecN [Desulfamplus magnetovallimortis]SLM27506.1 RecN [Desulfamplus magnetovallimortis]
MLGELAIKNFAIIDDLRISFSNGLSVLTGETGAGKSIIIEAVNLLLGGRASTDLVRTGEKQAELEAFFPIEPDSSAAKIMRAYDLDPFEGLMIRRIIAVNGRHRIFVNSRQSTIQFLKQVTRNLASISSQHAHQGLLNEENHLDILDTFAGTHTLRNTVQELYGELLPLLKNIYELKAGIEKAIEDNEFIRYQIDEIESAQLKPDEDEALETERNRLKNGTEIYESLNSAMDEIYSKDGSVLERLGKIRADFEKHGVVDKALSRMAETLSRSMLELEDFNHELRRHCDTVDLNPDILEETEVRLDFIQKLKRKYGGHSATLDAVFKKYKELKSTLSGTENMAGQIEQMEEKAEVLSAEIGRKAIELSGQRQKAALELATLAEGELKSLEMENTRFRISVTQVKKETKPEDPQKELFFDPLASPLLTVNGMKIFQNGIDRVSFLMAPNLGEQPRPLSRIASGGELSRVVLALKAILTETEPVGTLVFDEVDSGIGGRTADKVGMKLKLLSEKYQLLCITHLTQIARYGTHHYRIEKKVINNRTSTVITPLKETGDRIREIARMMGGSNISQATLDHAAEMLE